MAALVTQIDQRAQVTAEIQLRQQAQPRADTRCDGNAGHHLLRQQSASWRIPFPNDGSLRREQNLSDRRLRAHRADAQRDDWIDPSEWHRRTPHVRLEAVVPDLAALDASQRVNQISARGGAVEQRESGRTGERCERPHDAASGAGGIPALAGVEGQPVLTEEEVHRPRGIRVAGTTSCVELSGGVGRNPAQQRGHSKHRNHKASHKITSR